MPITRSLASHLPTALSPRLLGYSFFFVCPLHVSTSTTQSRGSRWRATRGGYFTQSVAIIEYLPAHLLSFSLQRSRPGSFASSRATYPQICAQVRYLKPTACLPTVITCHLAGRDKNPPIAINHGELEKTARGNAHRAYTLIFSSLLLSFSLLLSQIPPIFRTRA